MQTIRNVTEMQQWSHQQHQAGHKIAFVPTMGALHAGHISLITYAHQHADKVVVSIFVNPLQFDNPEDLKKYPRGAEQDLLACEAEGVDVVFMPTVEEMYPDGYQTNVQVKEITQPLCGAARAGHFDGVATVVLKLFNMVQANCAVFGEKDFQQLAMIRRMVMDLNLPLEIIPHPIVREPDGLALSSRNQRLSETERQQALVLWKSIQQIQQKFADGERDVETLLAEAHAVFQTEPEVSLDYLEIRDATSLTSIDHITGPALLAMAAFVGSVRLIDNCVLSAR